MTLRSKQAVKYTDHGTDAEHCSICTHYIPAAKQKMCEVVVGEVAPRGWCKLFKKLTMYWRR